MTFLPTFHDIFDDLWNDSYDYSSVDAMRTDIIEKDGHYLMNMELPGYLKENIQLQLKDGYLLISATKDMSNDEKDRLGRVIRRERYQGSCSRKFYVGDIKQEDIKASFENGELKVSIPKYDTKQMERKKYITID